MAIDDEDNSSARRLRTRRNGRGRFGAGSSTRSESLHTSTDRDEVDDAIDPEVVDRHVRDTSREPVRRSDVDDPRTRLNAVANAGSAAYSKEYRLTLLHRLLLARIPLDRIAQQLGVSISTVQKDRVELKNTLREQAKALNIEEMIGNQNALYDEIQGMSLQIAHKSTGDKAVPVPMRLAAMRTALATNADRTRFLHSAGVFDVLRFRRQEDGSALSDIGLLMEQTRNMLQSLSEGDDFNGFDDADDLDGEVIEL